MFYEIKITLLNFPLYEIITEMFSDIFTGISKNSLSFWSDFPLVIMDYSQAVKGSRTRLSMLSSLNSRAEVELGHKLSSDHISKLSKKFSLHYVFDVTEKVLHILISKIYKYCLVWFWVPQVPDVSLWQSSPSMWFISKCNAKGWELSSTCHNRWGVK